MIPESERTLSTLLERLFREGEVPVADFASTPIAPQEMGLVVRKARVLAPQDAELLDPARLRAALPPSTTNWLRDLRVFGVIDSTNVRMVEAAQTQSIDGHCWFAELQTAGRGRRGRRWYSPFARNLMVSVGSALGGSPRDAGALSLAVGLAVADLIERLGVTDVALKWPNDVLVGGAKVCGILIELVAQRRSLESVIGIGLNLEASSDLRAVVDQEITGLRERGVRADRHAIGAGLIANVLRYVEAFRRDGFGAMRSAYDEVHICQDRQVSVEQGNRSYEGTVLGVTDRGELRIRGGGGERCFNGGEVSLRQRGQNHA